MIKILVKRNSEGRWQWSGYRPRIGVGSPKPIFRSPQTYKDAHLANAAAGRIKKELETQGIEVKIKYGQYDIEVVTPKKPQRKSTTQPRSLKREATPLGGNYFTVVKTK